jgi:hypothetical protein
MASSGCGGFSRFKSDSLVIIEELLGRQLHASPD